MARQVGTPAKAVPAAVGAAADGAVGARYDVFGRRQADIAAHRGHDLAQAEIAAWVAVADHRRGAGPGALVAKQAARAQGAAMVAVGHLHDPAMRAADLDPTARGEPAL